jgi:hypothetical protein
MRWKMLCRIVVSMGMSDREYGRYQGTPIVGYHGEAEVSTSLVAEDDICVPVASRWR